MFHWAYTDCLGIGEGIYAYELTNALAEMGHNVHVLSKCIGLSKPPLRNITIKRVPYVYRKSHEEFVSYSLINAKRLLEDVDIIHQSSISPNFFVSSDKPLVLSLIADKWKYIKLHPEFSWILRELEGQSYSSSPMKNTSIVARLLHSLGRGATKIFKLKKKTLAEADLIVAKHRDAYQWLVKCMKVPEKKIRIIPDCIDTELFNPKRVHVEEHDNVILFVGGLVKEKGVHILLKALHHVSKRIPKIEGWIIGDGPQKNYLKSLIQKLNLKDNVRLIGYVPRVEIPNYYVSSSIFVYPPIYSATPAVFIEAMACERPVIATNAGGAPEIIIDNVTGLLVPPNDTNSLANAIITLLENQKLRKNMGKAGRKWVEKNFSRRVIAEKMTDAYKELL